jgi:hypothetical protein
MIWEYLAGELSVRLEQLQAATDEPDDSLAHLRHLVEDGPEMELETELECALALADRICWDSVSRGDIDAFARQASICENLRMLGVCAGLIDDD